MVDYVLSRLPFVLAGAPDLDIRNAAASYDFGAFKPMFLYASEERGNTKIIANQLGVYIPIGVSELRAAVGFYNTAHSQADWRKYSLGYGYNLSKRTQIYGAIARVGQQGGRAALHRTARPGCARHGLGWKLQRFQCRHPALLLT